jgi:hypothetical protein
MGVTLFGVTFLKFIGCGTFFLEGLFVVKFPGGSGVLPPSSA